MAATTEKSQMVKQLAASVNSFGLELYRTVLVSKEGDVENVFMSPFSIVTALAMTYLGAKENTAAEMKSSLHLSDFDDGTELHAALSDLQTSLTTSETSGYVLSVANRLFARQNYKFLNSFIDATKKHYRVKAQSLDFGGDPEGSRKLINGWVEDQTNKKIQDLIQEGMINCQTTMVLVNAIYFKGDWAEKFDPQHTRKDKFLVSQDEEIEVDMMFKEDTFRLGWSEELACQSLELPYVNKELSMVILLPLSPGGPFGPPTLGDLAGLERKLTSENLNTLLADASETKVMVHLPKFKVEFSTPLREMLVKMGMREVFEAGVANLSGMDGGRQLYLSEAIHKAFIEVNEEGSEAAAATAAMIQLMCMPPEFRANQPFLYLIRDNRSGSVLFMGRLVKPSTPQS